MSIDDIKLQLYVDGELDQKEMIEVENFIKKNTAAKDKVEKYRQINNLLFEKYRSIEQENLPSKTIDLLLGEKKSIFKKLFNYEIKLVNALAAAAIILFVGAISINYNPQNNLKNLNTQNKNLILNELSNIIGDENISILTSSLKKLDIQYETKREFVNNSKENCKEIQFYDFKLNDLNIDEAIFCGDKLIKLKFFKGNIKPI